MENKSFYKGSNLCLSFSSTFNYLKFLKVQTITLKMADQGKSDCVQFLPWTFAHLN